MDTARKASRRGVAFEQDENEEGFVKGGSIKVYGSLWSCENSLLAGLILLALASHFFYPLSPLIAKILSYISQSFTQLMWHYPHSHQ